MIALLALLIVPQDTLVVSPAGPYRTVAAAIARAPHGATVEVRRGTYREPTIVVDHALNLIGDSGAVLDGEGQRAIMIVTASDVAVRGFTFINTGTTYREDRAALRVADASHCTISGNRFLNTFFAIYLASASECVVADNVIAGHAGREAITGNGIHLWSSREIRVMRNVISGHRDGIYLEFTHHADVESNISHDNVRYGMHFMYSDSSRYIANTFRSNGSGVAVMYTGVVEMRSNHFSDNRGAAAYGLLLKEIHQVELRDNVFERNTVGLRTDGADRATVSGNQFIANGWGLNLLGSTTSATFSNNTFMRNTFDLSANGDAPNAHFSGNFWESYRGWDLDHDGVGDIPFHPLRLFAVVQEHAPMALLLQRSLFVRLLDLAERAIPVLTPVAVVDARPLMKAPRVTP
jgi:nitrous oxidase accessory protein